MSNDTVQLQGSAAGVRLRLRVKPGGRRNRLESPYGGALKVTVQAPPERGKANAAVVKLLAAQLLVTPAAVSIVAGTTSQDKVALVTGLTAGELQQRLQALGLATTIAPGKEKEGPHER